tara:strand:+ start:122 stop:313 length:192 start_codon:yes stop_codon:yes gene_type:complete
MAAKTATVAYGVEPNTVPISAAGSGTATVSLFEFNDDAELGSVLDNLEKCKIKVTDFYANKAT